MHTGTVLFRSFEVTWNLRYLGPEVGIPLRRLIRLLGADIEGQSPGGVEIRPNHLHQRPSTMINVSCPIAWSLSCQAGLGLCQQ